MNDKSFKVSDLTGCLVFDELGMQIGVLTDVLHTAANDVWVIKGGNSEEILIPALKTVVKQVDIANKKIIVELPSGLKEIYTDNK